MAKPLGVDDLQARIETVLHGVPKGSSAQDPHSSELRGNVKPRPAAEAFALRDSAAMKVTTTTNKNVGRATCSSSFRT